MSNAFQAFYAGLRSAVSATWPDVLGPAHPIFRQSQLKRQNWRNLVAAGRLSSPWVVILVSDAPQTTNWGLANVIYNPRVEIFYLTEAVDGERDMAAFIEGQLAALIDTLRPWSEGFQFAERVSVDTSAINPANAAILEENLPLFAGSVIFDVRFWSGTADLFFFNPRQLSVCKLEPFTITTNAGTTSAVVNTGAAVDLLSTVDAIAYNPSPSLIESGSEDGKISDYRSGGKEDFTLSIGSIDGDGRSQPLMDLYHARHKALRFSLRAKNLDGSDGKWLVLVGVPGPLRNGVVAGKNATYITLRPTWGVMPYWGMTPPTL